jgi:hypothetical protein
MADTLAKAAFLRELARTWQQFDLRVLLHKVRTRGWVLRSPHASHLNWTLAAPHRL